MLHTDSRIVASFDPHKKEFFQRGIMYKVGKKWVLKLYWRVNHDNTTNDRQNARRNKRNISITKNIIEELDKEDKMVNKAMDEMRVKR